MLTADVAVVGGGPAGVAAAITLARAGREGALVDKATFPRDKCRGDGMWSPLRKLVLDPSCDAGYLGEWHAFRQYFRNVSDEAASQLWVWFDEDLLPGYAWSFPLPGHRANVGFGILREAGSPTKSMK